MAEKEVSVRGKCSKLQQSNILRRTSEFQRFKEQVGDRSPPTLGAMLGVLSGLSCANAQQANVLGAVVSSSAAPELTQFCVDVICWAFAPDVERKLQMLRRTEKTDAAQACMLGLLEAINQETITAEENVIEHLRHAAALLCGVDHEPVHPCMLGLIEASNQVKVSRAAENVIARLRKGIDVGFSHLARSERRATSAFNNLQARALVLEQSEMAGHRARRKKRIRFDEHEREHALRILKRWMFDERPPPSSLDAWMAIVLGGEPIRDYLKRTSNSDREPTALECARVSNAKARATKRIAKVVQSSREFRELIRAIEIRGLFRPSAE